MFSAVPPIWNGTGFMRSLLSSPDFLEKVLLLLVAAALSGFLIPFILKQIEIRRSVEQKRRDAALARQAKMIDAQAGLLDSLARVLWDWRYAAMRVTYYGAQADAEQFTIARDAYGTSLWGLLSSVRFETSRARWLISRRAFDRLIVLYGRLIEFDLQLYQACQLADPVKRSLELSDLNQLIFGAITDEIDAILESIAGDVMLSVRSEGQIQTGAKGDHAHDHGTVGALR